MPGAVHPPNRATTPPPGSQQAEFGGQPLALPWDGHVRLVGGDTAGVARAGRERLALCGRHLWGHSVSVGVVMAGPGLRGPPGASPVLTLKES